MLTTCRYILVHHNFYLLTTRYWEPQGLEWMIFTKHQLHQEKFKPTQGQCQWVLFYFKKKDCSITYSGTKSEDYESLYKEILMKISKFKIPNFKSMMKPLISYIISPIIAPTYVTKKQLVNFVSSFLWLWRSS